MVNSCKQPRPHKEREGVGCGLMGFLVGGKIISSAVFFFFKGPGGGF